MKRIPQCLTGAALALLAAAPRAAAVTPVSPCGGMALLKAALPPETETDEIIVCTDGACRPVRRPERPR